MSVAHHESVRVLHADSEPDFADLAAMHLEREREAFDVCTATSATEGLDRLAEEDIDCIVSDYDMPGMDGLDFLEVVREEYPDLPFILFTGRGSEEIASEAISAGVTEYLNKGTGTDQYTVLADRIANTVEEYRAERKLIETDQAVRTILDSLPFVLYTLDGEGRFTRSQGKALETIGLEPGEVVGRSVFEVFEGFPESSIIASARSTANSSRRSSRSAIPCFGRGISHSGTRTATSSGSSACRPMLLRANDARTNWS